MSSSIKHSFLIVLLIGILTTGNFLPYVHGDFDPFAVTIFYISQFITFASLLLVPVGIVWCIEDFTYRGNRETAKYPVHFRNIALVISILIILAAALGAFASNSRFAAMIILGMGIYILVLMRRKAKSLSPFNSRRHHITPYYFIIVPLVVVTIRLCFLEKVKNQSTDFVIKQSETLIHDIEAYKGKNGHYPVSLQTTIEDYKPNVSGIRRFQYELNGNAYNLYFEQLSNLLGTQEIVMYNILGEHEMTVHNEDLLRIAQASISRGYHKVVDLPQKNWKIFYTD